MDRRGVVKQRLAAEVGTLYKDAPERIALVYPSPYSVGMSSLGIQTIYREINAQSGRAAERAFLPDEVRKPGKRRAVPAGPGSAAATRAGMRRRRQPGRAGRPRIGVCTLAGSGSMNARNARRSPTRRIARELAGWCWSLAVLDD